MRIVEVDNLRSVPNGVKIFTYGFQVKLSCPEELNWLPKEEIKWLDYFILEEPEEGHFMKTEGSPSNLISLEDLYFDIYKGKSLASKVLSVDGTMYVREPWTSKFWRCFSGYDGQRGPVHFTNQIMFGAWKRFGYKGLNERVSH